MGPRAKIPEITAMTSTIVEINIQSYLSDGVFEHLHRSLMMNATTWRRMTYGVGTIVLNSSAFSTSKHFLLSSSTSSSSPWFSIPPSHPYLFSSFLFVCDRYFGGDFSHVTLLKRGERKQPIVWIVRVFFCSFSRCISRIPWDAAHLTMFKSGNGETFLFRSNTGVEIFLTAPTRCRQFDWNLHKILLLNAW